MTKFGFAIAALCGAIFSAGSALAGAITITGGTDTAGDCTFACVYRYQQVYAASDFSGPLTITSVDFVAGNSGTWSAGASFTLSIGTSSLGVNNLSSTFANNIQGSTVFGTTVFSGTYTTNQLFGFLGSYNYDPSQGALIIDIS